MIAGIAGLCLLLIGFMTLFHHAPPVMAYDFHYRLTAPAALHGTQMFSGVHHTYLVVPPGYAVTQAMFLRHGHQHPVTPRRDGPYWRLSDVARGWRITTTGGVLTVTALGSQTVKTAASGPHQHAPAAGATPPAAAPGPVVLADPTPRPVSQLRQRIVALGFTGTRLSPRGQAHLIALHSALRQALRVRILAFSGSATPRSHHRAMRRAVTVAATLLRWGYPARHLHIRVLAGHRAALEITLFSAHTKDITP